MDVERVKDTIDLEPDRELITPDNYRWFTFSAEKTGLTLVCFKDLETGVIVTASFANPEKRIAAQKAWAGARHSRASGLPWEIMHEMGVKGVDPDQKLEETFSTYGHASVGDMARIAVDIVNCPMHLCAQVFNQSAINSGQEKSSRFQQRFGEAILHDVGHYLPEQIAPQDLEWAQTRYEELGQQSLDNFARHKAVLSDTLTTHFDPQSPQEISSLNNRVLDCVRYFLLFGQNTGMTMETSARDWSRIISELKASPMAPYRKVAEQLQRFLTPSKEEEEILGFKAEAPGLIRHTEASTTFNTNLKGLKEFVKNTDLLTKVTINGQFAGYTEQKVELLAGQYTAGDRMVTQYLLSLWPGLNTDELLEWVHTQDEQTKKSISQIIFQNHSHFDEIPQLAGTTNLTLLIHGYLGEARDWNRHRPWSRDLNLPLVHGEPITIDTVFQILAKGYGLPAYLTEIPELAPFRENFETDLYHYYEKLYGFVGEMWQRFGESIDYSFVINLLPLAHQVDLRMNGNPKQAHYMTHLRVRPGGHINYCMIAWDANQLIAQSDPYLSGLALTRKRPDPKNRDEFFKRN